MMTVETNKTDGVPLSYTITNERGWNDPPVHIFSPGGGGGVVNNLRKKTDLKKRVGHNLNSGYASPQPPLGPMSQQNMNTMQQNFQQMSMSHSNSNPNIHQMASNIPPPQIHHAASVPYNLGGNHSPMPPHHVSGYATPPKAYSGTHTPPADATPPAQNSPGSRHISEPFIASNGAPSIFSNHTTPTMLQSSHLEKPVAQPPQQPFQQPPTLQQQTFQPLLPSNSATYPPAATNFQLVDSAPSTPYDAHPNLQPSGPSSLPLAPSSTIPAIPAKMQQPQPYLRCNSAPGMRRSPINQLVGPPPTTGFYVQTGGSSSPKAISPVNGRATPPGGEVKLENDSELLVKTVKKLQDCREKCACFMNNRTSEDVNKRIKNFQQLWSDGKLSTKVKLQMSQLSIALQSSDFNKAEKIHKGLILDHSNEVLSWMVGIKKLIATSQQALQDNNKFE